MTKRIGGSRLSVVPSPAAVLNTVANALRPGGTAYLTVNSPDDPMFPSDATCAQIGALEFHGIGAHELRRLTEGAGLVSTACAAYSYLDPPHSHRPEPHEHRNIGLIARRPA